MTTAALPLAVLEAGGGQTDPPVHGRACRGPAWKQARSRYECACGHEYRAVPLAPEDALRTTGQHVWLDALDNAEAVPPPQAGDAGGPDDSPAAVWDRDEARREQEEAMQHDATEHTP